MPIMRYFFWVGGALLALLLVFDATQPGLPATERANVVAAAANQPVVRIHSDRKWPEKVVYDTSLPTIVPPPPKVEVAAVVPTSAQEEMSAKARVRESFAQFRPADDPKPEIKPQPRRKVAKARPAPPMQLMRVAQHPNYGFFANTW
jgi:hypothetical protein